MFMHEKFQDNMYSDVVLYLVFENLGILISFCLFIYLNLIIIDVFMLNFLISFNNSTRFDYFFISQELSCLCFSFKESSILRAWSRCLREDYMHC